MSADSKFWALALLIVLTCGNAGNVAQAANDSGPAIVRQLERIAAALEKSNRLQESEHNRCK